MLVVRCGSSLSSNLSHEDSSLDPMPLVSWHCSPVLPWGRRDTIALFSVSSVLTQDHFLKYH